MLNKYLFISLLTIVISFISCNDDSSSSNEDLVTGLVTYYHGNVDDESSSNMEGTVVGAVPALDRFDNENSAYFFDGNNGYIKIESSVQLAEFTICAWIKPVNININNKKIFVIDSGNDPYYYYFDIEGTSLSTIAVNVDGTGFMDEDSSIEKDRWTFITATYNSQGIETFFNGALVESGEVNSTARTGIMYLGGVPNPCYEAQIWYGIIDEVRLYDIILTAEQIDSLYHLNGWTGD